MKTTAGMPSRRATFSRLRHINSLITLTALLLMPLAAIEADDGQKPSIVSLLAENPRWDALEMKNLAAAPSHQDRLRQLRPQRPQFTTTLA